MKETTPVIKKFIIFWLPAILWAIIIFTFSSSQLPQVGGSYWPDFAAKKTAHVIEYAIFSLLVFRALKNSGVKRDKAMIYTIIIVFFYAISDEMHQSFIPVRTPKVRDVAIDTVSAVLSMFCLWKLLPKAPRRLKSLAESLQL